MNKKGVELTMNMVIIVVLVLIVLVVLAFVITGSAGNWFKATSCNPLQCKASCDSATEQANGYTCSTGKVCCQPMSSLIK
jgi:ABC-type uncharacterized transport system permease subunit